MSESPPQRTLAEAVAACLAAADAGSIERLLPIVGRLLADKSALQSADDLPQEPDNKQMRQLQQEPALQLKLDLVYGGATRVKEYVFEAPKLPEIRGASALLDYVTDDRLARLWQREVGGRFVQTLGLSQSEAEAYAAACVIYAGGGNFLAVAPLGMGPQLATLIEQTYTDWTLTAPSAAVSLEAMLIELRYGRLQPTTTGEWYWLDQALQDWANPDCAEEFEHYYYPGPVTSRAERFYQRKTFGELVALLAQRFYRRREERAYQHQERALPLYAVSPLDTRCTSSGVRPATSSDLAGPEQLNLSSASARKRFIGRVARREQNRQALLEDTKAFRRDYAWSRPDGVSSWDQWLDGADVPSWPARWLDFLQQNLGLPYMRYVKAELPRPAEDVSEIARGSKRYIGMIYADGNNVARYMGVARTPQQYQKQAQKLTRVARCAVFTALGHCLQPLRIEGNEWLHPFEILTIGGDDLLLIVPGDRALDIALRIGLEFERGMVDQQQPRVIEGRYAPPAPLADFPDYTPDVGLSAGVVIAQENTPIFFLRDLAEELLKNAKKLARKRGKQDPAAGGAVDFMVLRSITMVSNRISSFREETLGDDPEPNYNTIRLTGRPYSWPELAGLLSTARKLQSAGMPRSQLYRLRAILEQARPSGGVTPSMIDYLNARSRLGRDASDALKRHVEFDWRGFKSGPLDSLATAVPPWLRMERGGWETIWPDLTEIYDLLAREEA